MSKETVSDKESGALADWILGYLANECSLDMGCVSPADFLAVANAIHNHDFDMVGELRSQLVKAEKALREQDGMEYFGQRFDRAMDRAEAAEKQLGKKSAALYAFRNADEEDWKRLDGFLGYSGHGRFWRDVFKEFRHAIGGMSLTDEKST